MTQSEWEQVDEAMLDQALHWHGRMADATSSPDENDAFIEWLTSDPQHYDVFALLEQLEGDLDALALKAKRPANENRQGWKWPALAAVAATLLMAIGSTWLLNPNATRPPETVVAASMVSAQELPLEDGSVVQLAPNSTATITIDEASRRVTDFVGLGYFSVQSDQDRPFTVELDTGNILVVGTEFEVLRRGPVTEITVSEGVVTFTTALGEIHRIEAGQKLEASETEGFLVRRYDRRRDSSWETGQLRFENAPLSEIVGTINRYFGSDVLLVAPDVADRTFRGVLVLANPEQAATDLAVALDLLVKRDGIAYSLL